MVHIFSQPYQYMANHRVICLTCPRQEVVLDTDTEHTVYQTSALWAGGANDRNKMPQIGVILAPI